MIVNYCTDYNIKFSQIILIIQGNSSSPDYKTLLKNLDKLQNQIILYNVTISSISLALGILFKTLIRKLKCDRKSRYYRFSNRWYYIFNGELLDFPEIPDSSDDINAKVVDALVSVNGVNIIYIGYFYDYQLKADGSLDAIFLQYPMRRDLNGKSNEYYNINSRFIVLKYENITNLNFRYFHINFEEKNEIKKTPTLGKRFLNLFKASA
ncbi:hypothetical protein [Fulvivirga sediminis]|uniref:Uncharacterized protein n=1 Tax=Fulvivirga sediminis TaxID=2803949 RepID=A0A937JZ32_9BACT|nr:hypothetical protein [Fulvivirga sediminis]MBL3656274.1 hypothetical protein [Fulvivirga sediminis]